MARVSSPSVKSTIRFPEASRKLNAFQSNALINRLGDDRPLIRKQRKLHRIANQRGTEENIVVIVRERRDDVRLVAEFDERDQIPVFAIDAEPKKPLGGGDRGEEGRIGLGASIEMLRLERRSH